MPQTSGATTTTNTRVTTLVSPFEEGDRFASILCYIFLLVVDCLKDEFELLKAPRVHELYIYNSDRFVFRYISRLEALGHLVQASSLCSSSLTVALPTRAPRPLRRGFEPPLRAFPRPLDPFEEASSLPSNHLSTPRPLRFGFEPPSEPSTGCWISCEALSSPFLPLYPSLWYGK